MKQADVRIGDRVEGKRGTVMHGRRGTVRKMEDGGDFGYSGKVARVVWDGLPGSQLLPVLVLRVVAAGGFADAEAVETAEAMTRGTRWEDTPAGFRGESEDVYSAAVAAIAAVLAGQDKVQTVAPGWIVQGELSGPEIRVVAVPADDAKGRAAVQGMKRMRGG